MGKKKILVYLHDDQYIRNYLTNNALEFPGAETVIYAYYKIRQKYFLNFIDNFKGYLYETEFRREKRFLQLNILLVKYIKRSKTFRFRLNRMDSQTKSQLSIYGLPVISDILLALIDFRLGENKQIKEVLLKEKPDLVIVPTSAYESVSMDIIAICNRLGIKTLFLSDNWDNLSSKTIFYHFPTYLTVWGQQSKEHAERIHKFPSERVFRLGTPRFESYILQGGKLSSPYDFKYILFTGCALAFDEISALKTLDYCLIKNNIKDIKIIYRPHPWRQPRKCFDYFIEEDFQNIIIDKQVKGYYYYSKTDSFDCDGVQPPLRYYPNLIANAIFTISPPTSMLIEVAMMNKYVLVLGYDDNYHYTNPKNTLQNYEHLSGIDKISAFKFCYDLKELPDRFLTLLEETKDSKNKPNFKNEIKHIIEISNEKYSERLNRIVGQILEK